MGSELGAVLPAWSAVPFLGMLLSIALLPLQAPSLWHRHFPKVTAGWALLLLAPLLATYPTAAAQAIAHTAVVDYAPFLILISTLFTIGGGIHIRGGLRGTPAGNTVLLAIGTVLASFVGTTGAAMLMIRPLLLANAGRVHRTHTVVFFIFLVANIGGALTPLGDPPLFLGFLHGVPFFWTLSLWEEMASTAGAVLAIYVVVDLMQWRREDAIVRARPQGPREPVRIDGALNLLFLASVLAAVILSGFWPGPTVHLLTAHQQMGNLLRDGVLLLMLLASWSTTSAEVREANGFSWGPIREVGILFAGIFATIIPALAMLQAGERGALAFVIQAVRTPAHFFWASGGLSSFLDNAPTYLTFLSTVLGQLFPGVPEHAAVTRLIAEHPVHLRAIATGSVFMGANSYIGNAPNFMVKSIAEEAGVPMPSFFGYIARYSIPVLIPTFLLATWLFFT